VRPIRHQLREVNGKREVWSSLDDILVSLAEWTELTEDPHARKAALEIREMLIESVTDPETRQVVRRKRD